MTPRWSARFRGDRGGTASFSVLAVLLLVMCSASMAVMEAARRDVHPPEGPSLVEAGAGLEAFLGEALDEALERALPVAATNEGVGLGEALDAVLHPIVREGLPDRPGGWGVTLLDVRGGLTAGPTGGRAPFADLLVALEDGAGDPPVRLSVTVAGAPGPLADAGSRGCSVQDGLSGPGGPVAYGASNVLWAEAQTRVFQGVSVAGDVVTVEDVVAAVRASLVPLVAGAPPLGPRPPAVDLRQLVGQSVAGAVERNSGWLEGYISGVPGSGPLAGLRSSFADWLAGAVVDVLEAGVPGALLVVEGGDLEGTVRRGLAALEGLDAALGSGPLGQRMMGWVDAALPRMPDAMRGPLVDALATGAASLGRSGLACARDALVALGHLGRQVAGGEDAWAAGSEVTAGSGVAGGSGVLGVRLGDLSVSTRWTGVKVTDPPDALTLSGPVEGAGTGALPYTSGCAVSVAGEAVVEVLARGATGRPLRASWRVPVDLGWEVAVVTGRPLEGVDYAPSATLSGDLARVAGAVWSRAAGSVGWLTARFRDAAEAAGAWGTSLLGDMRGTLMTESAYTLSRALWGIGDALLDNETGRALNGTWDLFSDLFGDDLREAMTWELRVMGSAFVVVVDPVRQQVEVSVSRGSVAMNLTARRLCDPHPPFRARPVEGYYWGVFGEARLDLGGRGAVMHFDPLTLERDSVLTMEVSWGGSGDGGVLVVEALEARRLGRGWTVSLSDLSGVGWLLSVAGGGVADAGLAVHGDALEEGEARKALERALKDAWLATMRGWRVGDLLGETGRGPDAGTFLGTLMRELHAALVKRGGKLLSRLEVFLEVDLPTPGWPSVRLSLVLAEPLEALLPLAAWVKGSLEGLLGGALAGSVEGAAEGLASWLAEHLSVRFELSWEVEAPAWLASRAGGALPDRLGLVVRGEANVAALAAVVGRDAGQWATSVEVMLRGVPGAVLALVPGMGSPSWKWAEVTLLRATAREASPARLLLSQVLYDAAGRDADLEYVELVNAGRRVLDLRGFSIRDSSGGFQVAGHAPVLPGDHLLVARNSSAVRGRWGVVPDVGRMGLRLANDGDVVMVVDPDGTVLDLVAWEGGLEGWEDLDTGEGRALLRLPGDGRPGCRAAWYVGDADPRGSTW